MKNLSSFLNPPTIENEYLKVSDRFKDENGKVIEWELRSVMADESEALMKKYTKRDKKGVDILDRQAYATALVCSSVIYPDLKNAELQKGYGVLGEGSLIHKMLTLGEYTKLSTKVSEISGLLRDDEAELEKLKN